MKNRFHQRFADHPVLLNLGLGADRIWFARDAVATAPSQYAFNALVKRSEQLGAPVLIVHSRSQMAQVSSISSSAAPDAATFASISRLSAAQKVPARVVSYTPNNLKIEVCCPEDGWVLVTDRWAAGWRGKANGNPVEVLGGNFIFRAVRVRAGENIIQFYYPQPLYFGLVLLSWTILAVVFAMPGCKTLQGALGCLVGRSTNCNSAEITLGQFSLSLTLQDTSAGTAP
jgi:hypothetical protein